MRYLKIFLVGLLLAIPGLCAADARDIPGSANWYFHVDFERMKSEAAGQGVYEWLVDEVFADVKEEAGVDLERELDRLTAFSLQGQGPIILFEGKISQESKDKIMLIIAAAGDLQPKKASGKDYYHFANKDGDNPDSTSKVVIRIDSLEDEAWISLALKNKIIVTASEQQMHDMLANKGKIAGGRKSDGALVVLTAEKTLLQAGMNSSSMDDDGDSGWESNILRNAEQIAVIVFAAANKLAIEATLITTEPDMATSLASVARGLISLVAFNDDMDAEVISVLQGTKVEAKGNKLIISLSIDPDVVVAALND